MSDRIQKLGIQSVARAKRLENERPAHTPMIWYMDKSPLEITPPPQVTFMVFLRFPAVNKENQDKNGQKTVKLRKQEKNKQMHDNIAWYTQTLWPLQVCNKSKGRQIKGN